MGLNPMLLFQGRKQYNFSFLPAPSVLIRTQEAVSSPSCMISWICHFLKLILLPASYLLNWNTHLPFPSFFVMLEEHPTFPWQFLLKHSASVKVHTCPCWKLCGSSQMTIKTAHSAPKCLPERSKGHLKRIQMAYACLQHLSMLQNTRCAVGVG